MQKRHDYNFEHVARSRYLAIPRSTVPSQPSREPPTRPQYPLQAGRYRIRRSQGPVSALKPLDLLVLKASQAVRPAPRADAAHAPYREKPSATGSRRPGGCPWAMSVRGSSSSSQPAAMVADVAKTMPHTCASAFRRRRGILFRRRFTPSTSLQRSALP
ncbi:hypothetical protein PsYK624_158730 [Phanerochaete sordida]|uniref:Uncharacterized protein n=1 Tax=Phanerochaete sordida TaxID=48140 RepID=A0A9P3GQ12_9APHY|nr:hypothetical protein PsYK624_158730 [Phanerochaete sordida]